MINGKQYAYTGPMPDKGYVGYFNITDLENGSVRITVRSEGEKPSLAEYVMPSGKLAEVCREFTNDQPNWQEIAKELAFQLSLFQLSHRWSQDMQKALNQYNEVRRALGGSNET